jgi:hypothetical protein
MVLPGRLRSTTLGDLLGTLYRARASGSLELIEDRGRIHRVHVVLGRVSAVELDGAGGALAEMLRKEGAIDDDLLRRSLLRAMASRRLLGDVLVRDFHLAPDVVDRALRRQLTTRLNTLEKLPDARVCFRVAVRAPRGGLADAPLEPREFLSGRRRARDLGREHRDHTAHSPYSHSRRAEHAAAAAAGVASSAWRVLGLAPGAAEDEIKRAFRRLAKSYHPDLHPGASDAERRELEQRFAEVTAAYRALVA